MTNANRRVYVAATYDTKGHEAEYVAALLRQDGLDVVSVDVSTTGQASAASVQAREVAASHPQGEAAVFTGDRGTAIAAMAQAFERYAAGHADLGALLYRVAKGKSTAIDAAELDRVLTAANTATVEKGLNKPLGRTAPLAKGATATAKIDAKADEIRKAEPGLTKQQAITKALSADPSLYAEYRAELGMGG